jgi:tight adherence protein B
MLDDLDQRQIAFLLLMALAAGGVVLAFAMPFLRSSAAETRVKAIAADRISAGSRKQSAMSRLIHGQNVSRRRKVQDSLKQTDERAAPKRRGVSVRTLISRSGLQISVRNFWLISAATGLVLGVVPFLLQFPLFISILAGIVGILGLPRWFLNFLSKRRQKAFIENLADAVDVMVRGLRAGLPLSDAMRVIATETSPPIGPEFMEVVEGQRVGITIEQGLERMFDRMPLPEVSFLGIVISIQAKSGGNLSEALGNLSKVLRDRKKMKAKVRSMAQEAKSSAAIIGALPFCIVGALFVVNPGYLQPLLTTGTGHVILLGCALWMLIGMLIMRRMINFDI